MNTRSLALTATLLILGAAPLLAQRPGAARRTGGPMAAAFQNPVSYLLEKGEELRLTEEQSVGMKVLADSLDALNGPDLDRMAAARASGDRGAMRELRPVFVALRERRDGFVARAKALLTEEQRPVADRLLEEITPRRRPGGRPGGAGVSWSS